MGVAVRSAAWGFAAASLVLSLLPTTALSQSEDDDARLVKEMLSDPKKKAEYIKTCITMLTKQMPTLCAHAMPFLDPSVCKGTVGTGITAKEQCTAMANGKTIEWKIRKDGSYGPTIAP